MNPTLDRLLSAIEVSPQPFAVCRIQSGRRMSFPVVHEDHSAFRAARAWAGPGGGAPAPLTFAPSSVMIVPPSLPHWVGDADPSSVTSAAAEQCALIGDGLVEFTAGDGEADTLLLCGAMSPPSRTALPLLDLPFAPGSERRRYERCPELHLRSDAAGGHARRAWSPGHVSGAHEAGAGRASSRALVSARRRLARRPGGPPSAPGARDRRDHRESSGAPLRSAVWPSLPG